MEENIKKIIVYILFLYSVNIGFPFKTWKKTGELLDYEIPC
jgi:hypothetical protein